jgi:type VI secretion system secreted protein VgrG
MANISQDDRIGSLTTPLGDNVLVLNRFDGHEALSELFEFRIEAASEQQGIDFNKALGVNHVVKIKTVDDQERYFNGVLVEARSAGTIDDLYSYHLVLRPWLWLLSLTSDCRIFSSMKPPDIIKKVFSDRGFSDFRDGLSGSYPTLEYCVQYRETDLNFVCRLMEEYGIYYFFEHSQGKHTLVLADAKSSHKACDGLSTIKYVPATDDARLDEQTIQTWSAIRDVETGRYVLNDYDYNKPTANLLADDQKSGGYAHDSMEMYDYPGGYDKQNDGKTLAKVRLDADQSRDERRAAMGGAPCLVAGGLVTTQKLETSADNREYIVVRCTHFFGTQRYRSGGGGDSMERYAGNYQFTPSDRQFRAPLITPKALIHGVQSALVVGKQGEEIDVDDKGRITVQFYWDRKKVASRRVRVAQTWAGSKGHRGAWFLPRIGDEVLIQYEDGDPDRPIVIGSVYNGDNTVPTDLPSKKNNSGILTKSTKNSNGYNMLLFNDTAGSETVKLRAQHDLKFRVLNDETRQIFGSQTETVGGDETISVGVPPLMPPSGAATSPGGNWEVNALQTATINVGPILPDGSCPVPMTQVVMTNADITLNVGPEGLLSQIIMNPAGITLNYGPGGAIAQIMIGPAGINLMSVGPINFVTPLVNIPLVQIGAGTVGGVLPLI